MIDFPSPASPEDEHTIGFKTWKYNGVRWALFAINSNIFVPSGTVLLAVNAETGLRDISQYNALLTTQVRESLSIDLTGSRTNDAYILNTDGSQFNDVYVNYEFTSSAVDEWKTVTDLTIEFDLRIDNIQFSGGQIFGIFDGLSTAYISVVPLVGGDAELFFSGQLLGELTANVSVGEWHHIALVNKLNTLTGNQEVTLYIDGVYSGSQIGTAYNFAGALSGHLTLFQHSNQAAGENGSLQGGFDNILITKAAKYTDDFTPPGAITGNEPVIAALVMERLTIPGGWEIQQPSIADFSSIPQLVTATKPATRPESVSTGKYYVWGADGITQSGTFNVPVGGTEGLNVAVDILQKVPAAALAKKLMKLVPVIGNAISLIDLFSELGVADPQITETGEVTHITQNPGFVCQPDGSTFSVRSENPPVSRPQADGAICVLDVQPNGPGYWTGKNGKWVSQLTSNRTPLTEGDLTSKISEKAAIGIPMPNLEAVTNYPGFEQPTPADGGTWITPEIFPESDIAASGPLVVPGSEITTITSSGGQTTTTTTKTVYNIVNNAITFSNETTIDTVNDPISAIPATWDANPTQYTLTNSDLTATVAGYSTGGPATTFGARSGLWYFEVTLTGSNAGLVGVADETAAQSLMSSGWVGQDYYSNGWEESTGNIYRGGLIIVGTLAPGASRTIGVILDATARTVRYKNENGLSTDLSGYPISGSNAIFGMFGSTYSNTSAIGTINAGQLPFVHGLPEGANPIFSVGTPRDIPATALYYYPFESYDNASRIVNSGFISSHAVEFYQGSITADATGAYMSGPASGWVGGTNQDYYNLTDAATVEGWVYPATSSSSGGLFGLAGFSFRLTAGGILWFGMPSIVTAWEQVGSVPIAEWTHIAAVRSSVNGNVKVYISGVEVYSFGPNSDVFGDSSGLKFGSYIYSPAIDGGIDDVCVSSTAKYLSNFTPPTRGALYYSAPTDNVILALNFENGADIRDLSSRACTIEAASNITISSTGSRTGNAYLARTVDSFVEYAVPLNEIGQGGLTIEFDLYIFNGGNAEIMRIGDEAIYIFPSGLTATLNLSLLGFPTSVVGLGTDSWYNYALVFDPVAEQSRFYRNGVLISSASRTAAANAAAISSQSTVKLLGGDTAHLSTSVRLDNVLITTAAKYSANYTPPGAI